MTIHNKVRQMTDLVEGVATQDGAGVTLTRMIGMANLPILDPILLFDVFGSSDPQAYIAGFPAHPHRGFETVTYMLDGKMRHKDSAGHNGIIEAGDVQWMTAGKGIIHSEMPEQQQGRLAGLQLWLNLPADKKMIAPKYQEYKKSQFPVEQSHQGICVTVIAGKTQAGTKGPIENVLTAPIFWVIDVDAERVFSNSLIDGHNAFIYVVTGQIKIGEAEVHARQMAVLSTLGDLHFLSVEKSVVIVVAAKPLNEPVARSGPFVMNTRQQVEQAYQDYQAGKFTD